MNNARDELSDEHAKAFRLLGFTVFGSIASSSFKAGWDAAMASAKENSPKREGDK